MICADNSAKCYVTLKPNDFNTFCVLCLKIITVRLCVDDCIAVVRALST